MVIVMSITPTGGNFQGHNANPIPPDKTPKWEGILKNFFEYLGSLFSKTTDRTATEKTYEEGALKNVEQTDGMIVNEVRSEVTINVVGTATGAKLEIIEEYTPMRRAAKAVEENDLESLKAMPELGDLVLEKDDNGNTLLHIAAKSSNKETIAYLSKEAGKQGLDSKNNAGNTPLHIAAENGNADAIEAFGKEPLETPNNDGDTPLHLAVKNGKMDVIESLKTKKNIEQGNKVGDTPLHVAIKEGHNDLIRGLATVQSLQTINREGDTPLHIAAEKGGAQELVAEMKVKMQSMSILDSFKAKNNKGQTPLHNASANGNTSVVKLINKTTKTEADLFDSTNKYVLPYDRTSIIDARDNDGKTPLHLALENIQVEASTEMIESVAAENKQVDTAAELINAGAPFLNREGMERFLKLPADIQDQIKGKLEGNNKKFFTVMSLAHSKDPDKDQKIRAEINRWGTNSQICAEALKVPALIPVLIQHDSGRIRSFLGNSELEGNLTNLQRAQLLSFYPKEQQQRIMEKLNLESLDNNCIMRFFHDNVPATRNCQDMEQLKMHLKETASDKRGTGVQNYLDEIGQLGMALILTDQRMPLLTQSSGHTREFNFYSIFTNMRRDQMKFVLQHTLLNEKLRITRSFQSAPLSDQAKHDYVQLAIDRNDTETVIQMMDGFGLNPNITRKDTCKAVADYFFDHDEEFLRTIPKAMENVTGNIKHKGITKIAKEYQAKKQNDARKNLINILKESATSPEEKKAVRNKLKATEDETKELEGGKDLFTQIRAITPDRNWIAAAVVSSNDNEFDIYLSR